MDSSKEKGVVFILNNNNFQDKPDKERQGSENDMKNVKHVFEEIGYEPKEHKDLTAEVSCSWYPMIVHFQYRRVNL